MIIGHGRIVNFLKKSAQGRLAHAYLFSGPDNLGKCAVAYEFTRILNKGEIDMVAHPDILIIEPEAVEKDGMRKEAEIGIDKAKTIQHRLSLSPYSAPYKIAIIDRADRLTSEAGNCLLKTIEEPAGKSVIILITSRPQAVLPTITSRCQLIKFFPVPAGEIRQGLKQEGVSEEIIRLANGRPGLAIQYLENPRLLIERAEVIKKLEDLSRADLNVRFKYAESMAKDIGLARQILKIWRSWFRDRLLADCNGKDAGKLARTIRQIGRTDSFLSNASFNGRLALEVLMLEL